MKYERNADLTGRKHGNLLVLNRANDKILGDGQKVKQWECLCDCGNHTIVYEGNLKSGHTKSCGCQKYVNLVTLEDLTGQVINGISILKQVDDEIQPNGKHMTKWLCQCHCGKLFVTRGSSLKSKHTKSCGCRKKQLRIKEDDIVGKRFGKLTVVSRGEDEITPRGLRFVRWNCRCDCGRMALVRGSSLRDHHIVSCGCTRFENNLLGTSNGEKWIAEYLDKHQYSYEQQKHYADLVSDRGYLLFYDFLVHLANNRDVLIECQGKQHYEHIEYFCDYNSFLRQQKNDELKRAYAQFIDVPLIEIDYTITKKQNVINQLSQALNEIEKNR